MKYLNLLLLISTIACSCQTVDKSDKREDITRLFDDYHQFKMSVNPVEATKAGEYQYNDQLVNYISEEHLDYLSGEYDSFLERITQMESAELSETDRLSLEVMKWDCAIKQEGLKNQLATVASPMYDLPTMALMPLTQTTSFHLYMGQLAGGQSVHPFNTVKDYKDWLKRVEAYTYFLETAVENMKSGITQGVVLPKVIAERVADQLIPFTEGPAASHLFYSPVNLIPTDFSETDRETIAAEFKSIIESRVIPAYKSVYNFIINDYLPYCRSSSGIGDLPNGKETYDYLVRLHTSTDMTAEEIHQLGLAEVNRIMTEMEKVKASIGFVGDMKSFFDFVRNSKDQMPFTDPQQVIDNFYTIQEVVESQLGQLFSVRPKGSFEVRRTESFREASASAEFVPGTKDESRPGVFYVPIPDVKTYNKFADEALFLHEAIPGHYYQLTLQQENDDLPEFMHAEGIGVFVEGWALYAESLGFELGLYKDPYQYLGMLSMEMHRAIRLVVDSGIHAMGWTREEAIKYSLENEAESEDAIIAEIERYMVCPGQALSYKIGQLKIRELRDRAKSELGDQFDLRTFHEQVINSGSLPLSLLDKKITKWIAAIKK